MSFRLVLGYVVRLSQTEKKKQKEKSQFPSGDREVNNQQHPECSGMGWGEAVKCTGMQGHAKVSNS